MNPLAPDPTSLWFYAVNGKKIGPVSFLELRDIAASGKLGPTDMVLQNGAATWQYAACITGLWSDDIGTPGGEQDGIPRERYYSYPLVAFAAGVVVLVVFVAAGLVLVFVNKGSRVVVSTAPTRINQVRDTKERDQRQPTSDPSPQPSPVATAPPPPTPPPPAAPVTPVPTPPTPATPTPTPPTPAAPPKAPPQPKEPECLEFSRFPTICKDVRTVVSIEGQRMIELRPEVADAAKRMTSIRGKLDDVEIIFTPLPSFVRTPEIPNEYQARSSTIDRISFLQTHMKAKLHKEDIYAIERSRDTMEYAKVISCVIGREPGNLMIVGKSADNVERAFKKVKEHKPDEK